MYWLLLLLLLGGCANVDIPLPERCRIVGVAVHYDDNVTGSINKANIRSNTYEGKLEVQTNCLSPFLVKLGCTIPVQEHLYDIWYVDIPEVRDHERCHALYEEWNHTE